MSFTSVKIQRDKFGAVGRIPSSYLGKYPVRGLFFDKFSSNLDPDYICDFCFEWNGVCESSGVGHFSDSLSTMSVEDKNVGFDTSILANMLRDSVLTGNSLKIPTYFGDTEQDFDDFIE